MRSIAWTLSLTVLSSGCCTLGGATAGHLIDVATREAAPFPCLHGREGLERGGRVLVRLPNGTELRGAVLDCRCAPDSVLLIEPERGADLLDRTLPSPFAVTPGEVRRVELLRHRWAVLGGVAGYVADMTTLVVLLSQPALTGD